MLMSDSMVNIYRGGCRSSDNFDDIAKVPPSFKARRMRAEHRRSPRWTGYCNYRWVQDLHADQTYMSLTDPGDGHVNGIGPITFRAPWVPKNLAFFDPAMNSMKVPSSIRAGPPGG